MAYILAKKSKKRGEIRNLHYVVRSYRDGGKIKRETLLSMGEVSTIDKFLGELVARKESIEKRKIEYEAEINAPTGRLPLPFIKRVLSFTEKELEELEQFREQVAQIRQSVKCSAKDVSYGTKSGTTNDRNISNCENKEV